MSDLPLIGFGDPDDSANFAYFRVHYGGPDMGEYGDWTPEPNRTVRPIAGSNDYDLFAGGFGPSRPTLSLEFDRRLDFDRFRLLYLGTTLGTLSLLARFASHGGPVRSHNGVEYEQYTDTIIDSIGRPAFHIDGSVTCEAVFLRSEAAP